MECVSRSLFGLPVITLPISNFKNVSNNKDNIIFSNDTNLFISDKNFDSILKKI